MPPLLPFPRSIAPAPPPPAHGTHCAPRALDLRSAHTITDTTTTPPSSSPPSPGGDAPRPSVPDADSMSTALALLPDAALLATVCTLTARSNATLAALLAHLGEVEARGLHRHRACSSLYTYCLYELRLSEDAAFRRARAAGLVRRFPAAFGAIARGELHLTGLLQLGPHLTDDNAAELLARARYRTRREIARLVAELAPRPDAPAVLEPLGPEAAHGLRAPTHAEFTAALMGPVRSLAAGRAPADWLETALAQDEVDAADARAEDPREAVATHVSASHTGSAAQAGHADDENRSQEARAHAVGGGDAPKHGRPAADRASAAHAAGAEPDARGALPPPLRYRLQFTVGEAYVELLREVQDLASHALAPDDLAALHLAALEALAVTLRRRRHASPTPARDAVEAGRPAALGKDDGLVRRGADEARGPSGRCEAMKATERPRAATALDGDDVGGGGADQRQRGDETSDPRRRGDDATDADSRADTAHPRRRGDGTGNPRQRGDGTPDPRQRGGAVVSGSPQRPRDPARSGFADPTSSSRYVPAADRRAVWLRDGGRCTLVDDRGVRCRETRWLELHHLHAYARGGPTTRENLTLRCQAHNALASEQDFGREHALRARQASREREGALDWG